MTSNARPGPPLSAQQQLSERERELTLLAQTVAGIVSHLDLQQVVDLVAAKGIDLIQAETLLVPLIDPGRETYSYAAAAGKNAELILGQCFPVTIGMCGWVLRSEEALLFGKGVPWQMDERTPWEEGMESALLVPLSSRGHIIGGLSGLGKRGGGSFTRRDLELLTLFANQVSIAIDNAQMFEDLTRERERALVTLESIGDGVLTTDRDLRVDYLNPVAERVTGWTLADARGVAVDKVVRLQDELTRQPRDNTLGEAVALGRPVQQTAHTLLVSKQGELFEVQDSAAPIRDRQQRVIGGVLVFHDVSHARKMARKLSHQASHDALTGLPNRRVLQRRLRKILERAETASTSHVLLYMDLDQFKVVNDSCGHAAGDELLRQIAQAMSEVIRKTDLLARFGGDEFSMLLENCPLAQGRRIAEALHNAVYEFRFAWGTKSFSIGISIGMVPFHSGSGDVDDLLRAADSACYAAKDAGRNRIHLYQEDDLQLAQRKGEMQWLPRIADALERGRFRLYRQPIRALNADADGDYYEVLLRMLGEDGELVPPGSFLPTAERYGRIGDIDRWVLRQVVAKLTAPSPSERGNYSINLSAQSLGDPEFLRFVLHTLEQTRIDAGRLCFEIGETTAITELTNTRRFMQGLSASGCRFALDDFGSGLSTFGYLRTLPVDYLKIDGMFVNGVLDDAVNRVTVEAIARLAHELGIGTIAENVESQQVSDALKALGIGFEQGYHCGRPELWETSA